MMPQPARRRRRLPLHAAGMALALLPLVAGVTTAYAVSPAPAALPAAGPVCKPWQAPTTLPPGVTLTPRVFPPAAPTEVAATPAATAPTTATTAPAPATTPAPKGATAAAKPRVVCLNAPPTPFEHPSWAPDTVVGGAQLGGRGVVADLPPGVPAPPEVYDVSYVVADLDSGEILVAKSPHAWLRPASTLKTLTALTLLPRLDPRTVVVASEDAQAAAGSRVGILAGNRYTVGNLVDAMLMFSANDAVYALADAAGGYDKTVALMNETAREIGAYDTVVVDPSGLDEGDQRSSAYDLALIARDAMRLPAFRTAVVKQDAIFPGGKDKQGKEWKPFHIYNINDLLRHYPGAIGVKPGRTDRAQHTFIGAATRGGRTLLVAQMGSITGSWKPTAALLDWGFAHADAIAPVGRLVDPDDVQPPVADAIAPEPFSPAGAPSPAPNSTPTSTGALSSPPGIAAPPGALGSNGQRAHGPSGSILAVWSIGLLLTAAVVVTFALRRFRRTKDHLS